MQYYMLGSYQFWLWAVWHLSLFQQIIKAIIIKLRQLSSFPLCVLCPSDIDVRAWETVTEGKSLAARVLECYGSHSHPAVLCWDGSPSARSATPEWWPGHILCQHHLLVYTITRHLRSKQVLGTICYDDWKNGKKSWWTRSLLPACSWFSVSGLAN